MRKLTSGAVAIAAVLTIAGCTAQAPAGPATSRAAATATAGGSTGAADAPGTSPTQPAAPTGSTTAPASAPVDQRTPESVMTGWLTALVGGDSSTVCGLMAANGTAIEHLPSAKEECAKAVTPMLDQLASVKDAFKGLKVTGATIQGDTATFDKATTTPLMAATIIRNLKAVRLDNKWYVTQG